MCCCLSDLIDRIVGAMFFRTPAESEGLRISRTLALVEEESP